MSDLLIPFIVDAIHEACRNRAAGMAGGRVAGTLYSRGLAILYRLMLLLELSTLSGIATAWLHICGGSQYCWLNQLPPIAASSRRLLPAAGERTAGGSVDSR